jgi:hypothetical protein
VVGKPSSWNGTIPEARRGGVGLVRRRLAGYKYWNTVKDWDESSRYARTAKAKAKNLYQAITDKKHGVLSWIKSHW